MDYYSQHQATEVTSLRHGKKTLFSLEGIFGLDQVGAHSAHVPIKSSSLSTRPGALVENPAKSRIGHRRRPRTIYTPEHMEALEAVFAGNQYPDINSRETLAGALGMTESRVQVWFQNRRARLRREAKRKSSSSPSDTSSTPADSMPHQTESKPASPETATITSQRLSPDPAIMTSQRCTEACCSPPPIIFTSESCTSCTSSTKSTYSTNLSSFGVPQQYYKGAFTYAYYPHYAYYKA